MSNGYVKSGKQCAPPVIATIHNRVLATRTSTIHVYFNRNFVQVIIA